MDDSRACHQPSELLYRVHDGRSAHATGDVVPAADKRSGRGYYAPDVWRLEAIRRDSMVTSVLVYQLPRVSVVFSPCECAQTFIGAEVAAVLQRVSGYAIRSTAEVRELLKRREGSDLFRWPKPIIVGGPWRWYLLRDFRGLHGRVRRCRWCQKLMPSARWELTSICSEQCLNEWGAALDQAENERNREWQEIKRARSSLVEARRWLRNRSTSLEVSRSQAAGSGPLATSPT